MKRKQPGSALYIVVFTTAIIAFSLGSWWYRSSLQIDIAATREQYYRNLYATEMILNYGIQLIKENGDLFYEKGIRSRMPFSIPVNFLFQKTSLQELRSQLCFIPRKGDSKVLHLIGILKQSDSQVFSMSCYMKRVVHHEQISFLVDHWNVVCADSR
jgi:hypothetical protein